MLLDVKTVSEMLHVGQRTIWRFRDAGRMPAPITLGRSIRWRAADISAWVTAGCPDCARTGWKPEGGAQ
ncbi:MAG TPA: helix-turn-helix domain-containing protein [Candidatus Hydrogenedentes bacterium]|nr:helix-turn-helix domain-containing protein [Candidatus Hydrogenedentota bacterium]